MSSASVEFPAPPNPRRGTAALAKILTLGLLTLGLLIPLAFVFGLIHERSTRRDEVRTELGATWGGAQQIAGPVLVVPFERPLAGEDADGRVRIQRGEAVILPEDLTVEAELAPEERRRGIYSAVLYAGEIRLHGRFPIPDPERLGAPTAHLYWNHARLLVTVTDVRGLSRPIQLELPGGPRPATAFEPVRVASLPGVALGAVIPLAPGTGGSPLEFDLRFPLRGSQELSFAPLGDVTRLELGGTWDSPSYFGAALPDRHELDAERFAAAWTLAKISRAYPAQWLSVDDGGDRRQAIAASASGVRLATPADPYQQTTRCVKYAVLFLAISFGAFLLCELLGRRPLHFVQYGLVGAAIVLFYLLLLSFTEHLGFAPAYALAATATTLLIAGYARAILASRPLALALAAWLGILYAFLYVVLQLEDYALLMGSLFLFTLLATFMVLTRRLNWRTMELER